MKLIGEREDYLLWSGGKKRRFLVRFFNNLICLGKLTLFLAKEVCFLVLLLRIFFFQNNLICVAYSFP